MSFVAVAKIIEQTGKEANRFIALQWPDVPAINLQNENQ